MKKPVTISIQECENIQRLFLKYNAYMNMLDYLANSISNTEVYDKKWTEAAEIWAELDKAKRAVEAKYKPEGNWDSFEFDFDNTQVVFVKNET